MSLYDITLTELKRNIIAQKTIYKFRSFLYSINKDIRHYYFNLCKTYLENEYNNNDQITMSEKERLFNILKHWEWNTFENTSTNRWYLLVMNHSHSLSLMTLLHLWVDDIQQFDPETFETSTDGLR
jgi:hypothetical protein